MGERINALKDSSNTITEQCFLDYFNILTNGIGKPAINGYNILTENMFRAKMVIFFNKIDIINMGDSIKWFNKNVLTNPAKFYMNFLMILDSIKYFFLF